MLKIRARSIKAAAIVAIGFLFAGMTATAASAHTGDLHASAVCQADGTYLVTYTLDIDRAAGKTGSTMWKVGTTTFTGGTPTSNFGLVLGPVTSTGNGTITLGTTTLPGDSTKAPWAYAFTTWSDDFKLGSDGGDIALDGNCVSSQPEDKVEPGNWQDGQYECGATEVAITREIWTTTYKLNEQTGTWEAQAPVLTKTETSTRPLTPLEQAANACDIDVTPIAPTVASICGPDNDTVTLPTATGVTYTSTGWDNNSITITATEQDGYTLSGQTSWTFTDAATICPIELTSATPPEPTVVPICGPDNDTVTLPTATGVTYTSTGWDNNSITITAAAQDGYTVSGTSSWTFTDEANLCPIELIDEKALTSVPTVVPICGPNNDTVTLPTTGGVVYTASSWLGGQVTVTAAAADEDADLVGDSSWTFTDTPVVACPDEEPAFSFVPSAELAQTGTTSTTLGLAALAMLLLTGGTVMVSRKVHG